MQSMSKLCYLGIPALLNIVCLKKCNVQGLCIWLQVAAAARERADMAEQRLAQRAELSQERQQHIADLTQVNRPPKHILTSPLL